MSLVLSIVRGSRRVSLSAANPRAARTAAAVVFLCAAPTVAFAQAWLPMKGEGSISTGVQILHVNWHIERDGSRQEEANIQIRNVTADLTYGLTNRLALDVGLPYVASRFGELSHPCPDPVLSGEGKVLYLPCAFAESPTIDTGRYYKVFQDLRMNVRYAMWSRHLTLTPSIGIVLPVQNYETHGHAAPGRHLRELDLGLHAGRSLGPFAPSTYIQASYTHAVVQHLVHHELDLGLNRSNAELEVGHQVTPVVSAQAFVTWQHTHGGLEWVDELFEPGSVHEEIHDQAAKASHWRAGVGVSYAVTEAVGINVSVLTTLAGKNTHKIDGVTIGTTWSFGLGNGTIGGPRK